jgi:hypothetical protein
LANAVAGALVYLLSERHQAPVAYFGVYGYFPQRSQMSRFDGLIAEGPGAGGWAVSR